VARDPVREHDVCGEQHRVREGERNAHRLADQPNVREQVDARDSGGNGRVVPADARADHRQRDRPDELDRSHRRER
jgi:hypothetical protein